MGSQDNVYIGGLPPEFSSQPQLLQDIFSEFGIVTKYKVNAANPNAPGKFSAFVRFHDVESASALVAAFQTGYVPPSLLESKQKGDLVIRFADTPGKGKDSKGAVGPPPLPAYGKGCSPKGVPDRPYGKGDWDAMKGCKGDWDAMKGCKGDWDVTKGCKGDWDVMKVCKGKGDMMKGKATGKGYGIETIFEALIAEGIIGERKKKSDLNTLYVSGLPLDTDQLWLLKIFSCFGALAPDGITAMKRRDGSGFCNGTAFVDFADEGAAQAAILSLDGLILPDGVQLKVQVKVDRVKQQEQAPYAQQMPIQDLDMHAVMGSMGQVA